MPLFVPTPRNERVLHELGPYLGSLNLRSRKATPVQRRIAEVGLAGFEPETQALLLSTIQTARRPVEFLDVGAQIGFHSLLAAAVFPRDVVHVTALEPAEEIAYIARQIADTNQLSLNVVTGAFDAATGRTLDSYCVEQAVPPSVIRIGGDAFSVLAGARQVLADFRPAVVCSALFGATAGREQDLVATLHDLGYGARWWDEAIGWQEADVRGSVRGPAVLLTTEPLTEAFAAAFNEWQAAIADCPADANYLADPGTRPPAGWGAPHRRIFELPT